MKTILLSTSSLWNCGDDFIRKGIKRLLRFKEDVRVLWWNRGYGVKNEYANDLKVNLPLIDYFIVAGTPQWISKNEKVFKYCLEYEIPCSLIGIGTNNIKNYRQKFLLKKLASSQLCEAILCRDNIAKNILQELGFTDVHLMLDPAYFMTPYKNNENKINILGWRLQYNFDYDSSLILRYPLNLLKMQSKRLIKYLLKNKKKRKLYNKFMLEIFNRLEKPKLVVVHDNREIKPAEEIFGSENVFYATDSQEIYKRLAKSKKYIGSRIHGAIPSLINGAHVKLIYTSNKGKVVNVSKNIITKNYKLELNNMLQFFRYRNIEKDKMFEQKKRVPLNKIQYSIEKERQKTREYLLTKKRLKQFLK